MNRVTERLTRAFSPRRGLRELFVPAPGRLAPVDGLRALSILWVVGFHSIWYLVGHLPQERYLGLLISRWMLPLWRGDFGVDVFFVISGFLIGGLLLDERTQAGTVRIGRFYLRRLLRLWPALLVAVLVDQYTLHDFPEQAWAPLLYLTNAVSVARVPLAWTWSLSIEEQFYLACPWLLASLASRSLAQRLRLLGLLGLGLCGLGAWVVLRGHLVASDAELAVNRDPRRWIFAYDALYSKPHLRAGPLLAGVAAAMLYRDPAVMARLARARLGGGLGLLLAALLALCAMHWPLVEHAPRALEVVYLASFRALFGLAVAYVLLCSLSAQPLGQRLGKLLSSRLLFPFAQLAYATYLMNPIVTMLLYPKLMPLAPQSNVALLALVLSLGLVLSVTAALPLYLLVERPFMALRPGSNHAGA